MHILRTIQTDQQAITVHLLCGVELIAYVRVKCGKRFRSDR